MELPILSPPVTVNSRIYLGSMDKYIYAIDAKTGKGIWRFKTNLPILTAPIVSDNMIYVASEDGAIYALK